MMGKYMRKGKRGGEVAVEVTHASMGVRTRARTLALEQAISSSAKMDAPPHLEAAPSRLEATPRIEYCYLELRSRKLEKVTRFISRGAGGGNSIGSAKHSVAKSHGHSRSASVEAYRSAKVSDNVASNFSYCHNNNYEASHCSGSVTGRDSFNAALPLGVEMGVVSVGKMMLRSSSLSSHRLKLRKSFDMSESSKIVSHSDKDGGAAGAAMELSFEMEASFGDNTMDYECLSTHENQSLPVRDLRESTPTSNFSHMEAAAEAPGSTSRVRVNQSFSMGTRRPASESGVFPASHEIEEFFSHTEIQQVQKRLSERYNFDFDNDVPLEGRFEWCNLHHQL